METRKENINISLAFYRFTGKKKSPKIRRLCSLIYVITILLFSRIMYILILEVVSVPE